MKYIRHNVYEDNRGHKLQGRKDLQRCTGIYEKRCGGGVWGVDGAVSYPQATLLVLEAKMTYVMHTCIILVCEASQHDCGGAYGW